MRKLFLAVLLICAVAYAAFKYPPARIFTLVLLGRSPGCPMRQALAAPGDLQRQIELKDKILAASKRLEEDDKGFELWDTPKARYWIPKGNHYVLPFNLAEQERQIYALGEIRVKPGDVVLDCGANVGVFTREALIAGAKLVVAIEPAPENIECLRRNYAPEIKAGTVIVYPKGIWDKDDWLTLHVDPHNSAADSFVIEREGHRDEEKVPLTTIDKMVVELKLDRVDFIKMDIEGAEVRALNGGRATIAKFHPKMAVSAYHQEDHPIEIPKSARAAWDGYRIECGTCAEANWRVRPDILFFQ
jgi:FkbM family methyltransferase